MKGWRHGGINPNPRGLSTEKHLPFSQTNRYAEYQWQILQSLIFKGLQAPHNVKMAELWFLEFSNILQSYQEFGGLRRLRLMQLADLIQPT